MAQDYKNTKSVGHQAAQQIPGWVWLFTGLLIGLFMAFLIYLQGDGKSDAEVMTGQDEKATDSLDAVTAVEKKSMATGVNEHSNFEFYQVLKHDRVVVSGEDSSGRLSSQKIIRPSAPPVVEPSMKHQFFILQAGSFRRYADADQRKASLALLGIQSRIQKVVIKDNQVWHRVHVGPYDDVTEINEMRELLHSKKIDTLLMRI